jgi:hypothetical protein
MKLTDIGWPTNFPYPFRPKTSYEIDTKISCAVKLIKEPQHTEF